MPVLLHPALADEWYARLPEAWRTLDRETQLERFLHAWGDIAGGLAFTTAILEGLLGLYSVTFGDPATTMTLSEPPLIDGEVDGFDLLIPLEPGIAELDPDDPYILVLSTPDWTLRDPMTVPMGWLPWYALSLSVDLTLVPQRSWRAWIADPHSRRVGSWDSLPAVASYHLEAGAGVAVTRIAPGDIRITVNDFDLLTSEEELQASLTAAEACGVRHTLVVV